MSGNSESFNCFRRRCNNRHQPSANAGFLLILSLLSILTVFVNSQTNLLNYCGEKPCIEAVRMSCEEMMERYQFQGSCCSMEIIPSTGGCRITVSFGNCFWYPWCGTCDDDEESATRCNKIFETDANQRPCPVADFDPVAIQASENFTIPSCSPSMQPSVSFGNEGESAAAAPTSVVVARNQNWWVQAATTGAVALLVATIAAAIAVA